MRACSCFGPPVACLNVARVASSEILRPAVRINELVSTLQCAGRASRWTEGDAPSLLDDLARLESGLERRVERRRPRREERGPAEGRIGCRQCPARPEWRAARSRESAKSSRRPREMPMRRERGERGVDARDLAVHARPRGAHLVLRDGVRLEHVGEAAGPDLDGAGRGGARQGVRERLLVRRGLLRVREGVRQGLEEGERRKGRGGRTSVTEGCGRLVPVVGRRGPVSGRPADAG